MRTIHDAALKTKLKAFNRQALHAAVLSFLHPVTGERVVFAASLPEDMSNLCAQFRVAANLNQGNPGLQNWKDKLR
jgi:23S rRNA pseudouridine1911/1915/1917 synthase